MPSTRLDQPPRRSSLNVLRESGMLTPEAYWEGMRRLNPGSRWAQLASGLFFLLGATLLLASVIFFFAYNWEGMTRWQKLGLLNYAIYQKEQVLAEGETVYLRLAPVDPRSLMQGDYMVLSYALSNDLRNHDLPPLGGRIVLRLDDRKVAHFARLEDGTAPAHDEHYLKYKNRRGPHFGIESFFFQEGRGQDYAQAQYAAIKLAPDGSAMLIDLVVEP